jgi:hypothetical protein
MCNKEEADKLMVDLHSGHCGGHFAACTTAHKILRAGYYWPTIFSTHIDMLDLVNRANFLPASNAFLLFPLSQSS